MYNPAHFSVTDQAALYDLIRHAPLGMLVTHGPDGLDANHIPWELQQGPEGTDRLIGHMARARFAPQAHVIAVQSNRNKNAARWAKDGVGGH